MACEACYGCFEVEGLTQIYVVDAIFGRGIEDFVAIRSAFYCDRDRPKNTQFVLRLRNIEESQPEETRRFNYTDGWLQDVDEDGQDQWLAPANGGYCVECGELVEGVTCPAHEPDHEPATVKKEAKK